MAESGRYRLVFADDPSQTATLGLESLSGDPQKIRVHYDVVDHGREVASYAYKTSLTAERSYRGMKNVFFKMTGLKPGTPYYLVVVDEDSISERFWFRTVSNSPDTRLSLVAGGDSRNNRKPRQQSNMVVSRLRPDAVLFGGDMTAYSTNDQWRDWFDDWQLTTGRDGRLIPIVPARGNHEYPEDVAKLFDINRREYGALSFGGDLLRVYTLNSEISVSGDQLEWLEADLKNHPNTVFKMAQYHRPIRPHTRGKSDRNRQYRYWVPLFERHNVRLVIESDSHMVKSTWPVLKNSSSKSEEGFIRDDEKGIVYIGEGCWGAPLRSDNRKRSWTRDTASFNQVKWIWVDKNGIEARTINVSNAEEVGTVKDDDRFSIPPRLRIWSPSEGSVLTIGSLL